MTRVVFRTFKDDKEVIALFPDDFVNQYGECMSYMHYGQHSPADYNGTIRVSKPSTEEEYKDLLEELKYIGYNDLKICKRK